MKPVDQTLLQQMQIHEAEIGRRKELLHFTSEDVGRLVRCRPFIHDEIDNIVSKFYKEQTDVDEIALIIGDADTLKRLKMAQKQYILDLFAGFYDLEYVNNRLRIGMVHKRIGVDPKYYLSAVRKLKTILSDSLKSRFGIQEWIDIVDSLDKLLVLDVEFVVDTYIRSLVLEVEAARNKALEYAQVLEEKVAQRTRELEDISRRDGLTGIFNQRAFMEMLRRDIYRAERRKAPVSLIYFDIDRFKQVNDTEGHQKGDEILKFAGGLLSSICREGDIPARYGGDEFCLILPDATADGAEQACERLIRDFTARYPGKSLSMGIAQTGASEFIHADDLVRQADQAMYQAKKTPGSMICRFEELTAPEKND